MDLLQQQPQLDLCERVTLSMTAATGARGGITVAAAAYVSPSHCSINPNNPEIRGPREMQTNR